MLRLGEWADRDPRAMLLLLDDPELRVHLRSALAKYAPREVRDSGSQNGDAASKGA